MAVYRITYHKSIFNVFRTHFVDSLDLLEPSDMEHIEKIEKIDSKWHYVGRSDWRGLYILLCIAITLPIGMLLEQIMSESVVGSVIGVLFIPYVFVSTWLWRKINKHFERREDVSVQVDTQSYSKDEESEKKVQSKDGIEYIQTTMPLGNTDTQQKIQELEIMEEKKVANHKAYEGRISTSDKKKIKHILGTRCTACGKDMTETYGDMGKDYIELHHLVPYSKMEQNDTRTLAATEFCVLCPDCHRMIHRLQDAGDIDKLRDIITANRLKK